ncbi:MAG: FtsH protease activity modulator HflK [Thiotrichales bacterium]|jgi:HflK protein|nr:FtsH protease activity modulator HflK [Thiotrichales bacterium]
MAWNEPGKPGQDPWGNNSNGPNKPNGQKPDPDLDELLKKLQNFLGGGGSKMGGGFNAKGVSFAVVVAIIVWLLSGIYTVDSPERGVVKRFGAYVGQTTAGLHWHLPWPIESVTLVNVDRIRTAEIGYRTDSRRDGNVPSESLMLSKDENIVDIKIAVQYKVSDAKKYLYDVSDPDMTLRALTESALREVVGQNTMDFVLTEGRDEVVNKVKVITQKNLDKYETGLFITSLNLQDAQPPEQVQDSFADVVKAREDRERLINEAEAYSNDILPKARGNAARQIEEARAYHDSVIARATGQASRFDSIVAEYKKAPKVTRERLYIDAMTNVLEATSKVFVGSSSSNNLLYLPLDKMIGNSAKVPFKPAENVSSSKPTTSTQETRPNQRTNIRELLRSRELR